MVRKSGIAMATPRSIVDQVTGLNVWKRGVDLEPPGNRSWPGRAGGIRQNTVYCVIDTGMAD
jgi:hypothetical protein